MPLSMITTDSKCNTIQYKTSPQQIAAENIMRRDKHSRLKETQYKNALHFHAKHELFRKLLTKCAHNKNIR